MGIDQGGLRSLSASSCFFVVIMSDSDSGSNLFAALIQDSILHYVVIRCICLTFFKIVQINLSISLQEYLF